MYEKFFRFRAAPFNTTPDPRLYYSNFACQDVYTKLVYGISARKGFIVVTGEVGTGKTTLVHRLLLDLDPTVHTVFIFNTQITFVELLRLIIADLGLGEQMGDKLTMIQTLNDYLLRRMREGHVVCLFIDEAQNLNRETLEGLRLLSNLETSKKKLLQIVLLGQPELEKKLNRPELRQWRQRIALRCRLMPFEENEISQYIDFRLENSGYKGVRLFQSDAVEQIARYSGGIPRLINIICDNALLAAYTYKKKQVSRELITEVVSNFRLMDREDVSSIKHHAAEPRNRQEQKKPPRGWPIVDGVNEHRQFHDEVGRAGRDLQNLPQVSSRRPQRLLGGTLLALVAAGAVGLMVQSHQARYFVASLKANLGDLFEIGKESSAADAKHRSPERSSLANTSTSPKEPNIESGNESIQSSEIHTSVLQPDQPNEQTLKRVSVPTKSYRTNGTSLGVADQPRIQRRLVELQIEKALQNRAIDGVAVSFIDGTAYLEGQVASEKQRSLAEKAALSVSEVRNVHNRLDLQP